MKPTILILLMAMSLHSFSQERFSKRKYRKGMFTEKRHHVKTNVIAANRDVSKETTFKKATDGECSDVFIPANLPENRFTLEDTLSEEKQAMSDTAHIIFEKTHSDTYSHIPKHNTTSIDSTPYTSISAIPVSVKIKCNVIHVSEYKSLSKVRKSAYYGKPFSLKESWFLYSLALGIFLLVALSEGIIAALVVLVCMAIVIFSVCLLFMVFLKLVFFPNMEIF